MSKLYPKLSTIKKLFALCGNECAFGGCQERIVNEDGNLIGHVCHIEADRPTGLRFNEQQTEDERRSFDNLIILCPNHHALIDSNSEKYTVDLLKKMKLMHEKLHFLTPYKPPEKIINQSIYSMVNVSRPKWPLILSYRIISDIYSHFTIEILEQGSSDFLVLNTPKIEVIAQSIDVLGPNGTLFEIERKIALSNHQKRGHRVLMFLFCNDILDARQNTNKNGQVVFRKSAYNFMSHLFKVISGHEVDVVCLIKEEHGFSVLPKNLLLNTSQYYSSEVSFNIDSKNLETHSVFESYYQNRS